MVTFHQRIMKNLASTLLIVGAVLFHSSSAAAQAWTGAKGDFGVSLSSLYQTADSVIQGGTTVTGLESDSIRARLGVEYTPIDRLTLGLSVAHMTSRYSGPQSVPGFPLPLAHGENDDGNFNASFEDIDFDVLFQAYDTPALAIAPSLHVKVPTHDYESKGYAATGRGLAEVSAGANLGRIGVFNNRIFLVGGYAFTWVQKETGADEEFPDNDVGENRPHHSDAMLATGYLFPNGIVAMIGGDFRYSHGGFDLIDYQAASDALKEWHDPVARQKFLSISGTVQYPIDDKLSVGGMIGKLVWGDNVSNPLFLSLNVGWTPQSS